MIQLSRNYSLPESEDENIPIKIIGIGGAGSNALDRVVLDGTETADLIAMNTDVQSLASSVAAHKVQLGRGVTRGLGSGGDPELGRAAAEEAAGEIEQALRDARMIFLCAGLGGGTGSGAAPLVAQAAREAGSLVVVFATLPFSFEGKRRRAQAEEALAALQETADAVVCFENDRMGEVALPKAGIHQAFALADVTISQSIRAIINLIRRPGLIRIGFDDLLSALRSRNARCLFGFGESETDNRAHEALAQALKNPLMDRGRMLAEADHVLVQVAGGPSLTLAEVEVVMQELGKHIDDRTQILFGTAVDGKLGNRLSVTLISSFGVEMAEKPAAVAVARPAVPRPRPVLAPAPPPIMEPEEKAAPVFTLPVAEVMPAVAEPEPPLTAPEPVAAELPMEETPTALAEPEPAAPPAPPPATVPAAAAIPVPPLRKEKRAAPAAKELFPMPEKPAQARQETLQFEPVTRGRFEKSEPTIVEGQDLDVPTFLRKNVRVK